jgi:ligand-binding sensor domain-containing protein
MDPVNRTTIYAGMEHHGVYRSTDGGDNWEQWGLPGVSVYAILLDRAGGLIWLGTENGVLQRKLD